MRLNASCYVAHVVTRDAIVQNYLLQNACHIHHLASLLISGVGYGAMMLTTTMFLMNRFDRLPGTVYGVATAGLTMSGCVFPQVIFLLMETFGFFGCLFIVGAITMNLTPLSRLLKVPSQRQYQKESANYNTFVPFCVENQVGESKQPDNSMTGPDCSHCANSLWKNKLGLLGCSPRFYLIVFSTTIASFADTIFASTMIDFGLDKGLEIEKTVLLMSVFATTDVLGNVFLPLLADKGYMRNSTLLMLTELLMAFAYILTPYAMDFSTIAAVFGTASALVGTVLLMHDVTAVEYFRLENLPMVRGIAGIMKAPVMMCGPVIVGEYGRKRH